MRNRLTLIIPLVLFVLMGSACGRAGSATNEIGLIYSGGVTEDKAYKGILRPGSTWNPVGWGSDVYRYRTDQRTYIANADNKGADAAPFVVVSSDDVQMVLDYQLYFKLKWGEESIMKQFHENLGVKTKAWTEDGWKQLLREYFEPQIERSLEAAALKHPYRELYASEEARRQFNTDTVTALKTAIREVIGGDYFCGPIYNGPGTECGDFTFTVGKPRPVNPDIVRAIESEQQATAATVAQAEINRRIEAELLGEKLAIEMYGPQGALFREAIRSGKVAQIIVDQAGRSTVPVR